jgi:site-specific recombinase XerD
LALTIYRRHTTACKGEYAVYDRKGKDCTCVVHVEGVLAEAYLRESTGTRSWTQAERWRREAERTGVWKPTETPEDEKPGNKSIHDAVAEFLSDRGAEHGRNLSGVTVSKYRTVLTRLLAYCDDHSIETVAALNYGALNAFRRTWKFGPQTAANNIARLRNFFKHCLRSGFIAKNHALDLDMPENYTHTERLPFEPDEMKRILESARTMRLDPQQPITNEELEVFVLVMRYGGLAIADASLLQKNEVRGDEIRYFRKKLRRSAKRQLVVVPLPTDVMARLKKILLKHGKYFFCHGSDHLVSVTSVWQSRLQKLFEDAQVENGTSHRFRHSFATTLLQEEVGIELVSRWLGHASIRVTERHYSHYLEGRIRSASDVLRKIYKDRPSGGDGNAHA